MKELKGLKVEVIAVPFGVQYDSFKLGGNKQCRWITPYSGLSRGFNKAIPIGKWKILGRSMELNDFSINKLLDIYNPQSFGIGMKKQWQSYCTANNLTNELILIKV
jgi:hypothetical protein